MTDGWRKNVAVVREDMHEWWAAMKVIGQRMASPSFDPKDREHFVPHVLMAAVSDTVRILYRFWSYLLVSLFLLWIMGLIGG